MIGHEQGPGGAGRGQIDPRATRPLPGFRPPMTRPNATQRNQSQDVRRNYARSEVVEGKGFAPSRVRRFKDFADISLHRAAQSSTEGPIRVNMRQRDPKFRESCPAP